MDEPLPSLSAVWEGASRLCNAYAETHANAAFSASLLRDLRERWEPRVRVTTSHFDLLFTRPGHRPLAGQPGEAVQVRLLTEDRVEMLLLRAVPRRGETRAAGPVTVTGDFTRPDNALPAVEALLLQLAEPDEG